MAAVKRTLGSMAALKAFREYRKQVESGQIQLPDLTLVEINEEIRVAREERAAKVMMVWHEK